MEEGRSGSRRTHPSLRPTRVGVSMRGGFLGVKPFVVEVVRSCWSRVAPGEGVLLGVPVKAGFEPGCHNGAQCEPIGQHWQC